MAIVGITPVIDSQTKTYPESTTKTIYVNADSVEDVVNHPKHYISKSGIETIDVIEAFTSDLDGMEAYCTGNVLKYMCRWKNKNGIEDLKKAAWYLDYLIKYTEEKGEQK